MVKIDTNWITIDATWDQGLQSILPVNVWEWSFKHTRYSSYRTTFSTSINSRMDSPRADAGCYQKGSSETGVSAVALNKYLDGVRSKENGRIHLDFKQPCRLIMEGYADWRIESWGRQFGKI